MHKLQSQSPLQNLIAWQMEVKVEEMKEAQETEVGEAEGTEVEEWALVARAFSFSWCG